MRLSALLILLLNLATGNTRTSVISNQVVHSLFNQFGRESYLGSNASAPSSHDESYSIPSMSMRNQFDAVLMRRSQLWCAVLLSSACFEPFSLFKLNISNERKENRCLIVQQINLHLKALFWILIKWLIGGEVCKFIFKIIKSIHKQPFPAQIQPKPLIKFCVKRVDCMPASAWWFIASFIAYIQSYFQNNCKKAWLYKIIN